MSSLKNKCALIYGSCTGKTEYLADSVLEKFSPFIELELIEVTSINAADLSAYQFLICGIPTWDFGELEYGWQDLYDKLDEVDMEDVAVAIFGLGDQRDYPETYQDAMGILYKKLVERGARGSIGFTSIDGHEFDDSRAVIGDQFCGLALDEDNQDDLSDARIHEWAQQVIGELKALSPDMLIGEEVQNS
ncbi:MAG: flavodoxin [Planctomycetota bacterium]